MTITVNGKPTEVIEGSTGTALLEHLDLAPRTIVAEVNRDVMERAAFLDYQFSEGDSVELVTLVGGG